MSTKSQTSPHHDEVVQNLYMDQRSPITPVGQQGVEVDPKYIKGLTKELGRDTQDVNMDPRPHEERGLATPYHHLSDSKKIGDWSKTLVPIAVYPRAD